VTDLSKAGRPQSGGDVLTTLTTPDGEPHARPREPFAGTGKREWQSDSRVEVLSNLLSLSPLSDSLHLPEFEVNCNKWLNRLDVAISQS